MSRVAIALDIDGILVNERGVVFPEVKSSLIRNWDTADFIIASARPRLGVESVLKQVGKDNYYIALNGGVIVPGIGLPTLNVTYISTTAKHHLLSTHLTQMKDLLAVFFFTDDKWYAWGDPHLIADEKSITRTDDPYIINYFSILNEIELAKITIVCNASKTTTIWKKLVQDLGEYCNIAISKSNYIEITNNNVSKGKALVALQKVRSWSKLIAVGDGLNDLPMFEIADISYTVHRARSEVKAKATYILEEPTVSSLASLLDRL